MTQAFEDYAFDPDEPASYHSVCDGELDESGAEALPDTTCERVTVSTLARISPLVR